MTGAVGPCRCNHCGSPVPPDDEPLECPSCMREGCATTANGEPGCMPGGEGIECPECENGEGERDDY